MSTHNIGFYEDLAKIIFELSSNTHLIFSAEESCLIGVHTVFHSVYTCVLFTRRYFSYKMHISLNCRVITVYTYEQCYEKTCVLGLIQSRLYNHRRWIEA